uniref:Uncharacterized protein n=1 Tax=Anguilla anguilla TaxID=7936 RepID=A0A0E9Y206_ANGAN
MPIFPMGRLGSANVSRTGRVQHVARNRRQEAESGGRQSNDPSKKLQNP